MPINKEQVNQWQDTLGVMISAMKPKVLGFLGKNSDSFYSFKEILAEMKDAVVDISEKHLVRVLSCVLAELEMADGSEKIVYRNIDGISYYALYVN